jgi:iron complex outermembrane receptor protein
MQVSMIISARRIFAGTSAIAIAVTLLHPVQAVAQASGANTVEAPPKDAPAPATTTQDTTEIIVTGSRIERAGYSQPTPTTVLGATELREGNRPSIQQALNDQPQFRGTTTQATTAGLTGAGTAPVDLRGLGSARTLTLINGRRFVGENNLNFVPLNLVSRVDVVTGGASAAYGSGAVAGVVNIVLNDKLQGLSLGTQYGISSRGDGRRYGFDGSFGTSFAGGRGHFMTGAEYVNDEGIGPEGRLERPEQGAGVVRIDPTSATDKRTRLTADVNYGNTAIGGLITTGVLAGQIFNPDGTLRPFRGGTQLGAARFNGSQIGGLDATSLFDNLYVASPVKRITSYSRVSFDVGGATIWADATYGRASTNYPFIPELTLTSLPISASNPFLSATVRNQLTAAGQTGFTLGGFFPQYALGLNNVRKNYEGAVGIDGRLGRFKYDAHYSHGEVIEDQQITNSRLRTPFANAINAVAGPGGAPVCAINADLNPVNDDPTCAPINPFGANNVSAAALAYTTGTQVAHTRTQLDAAGAQIQGDILSLPAGPLTVVVGSELRYEKRSAQPGTVPVASQFSIPLFTSVTQGKFNVKEGYAEAAVPVFNVDDSFKLDLNGAARYSDYSTSGGIWSWKAGGTLRLFKDLLLRGTESRDIRSPNITDLFSVRRLNIAAVVDAQAAQFASTPGYNANPQLVSTFSGGNPNLVPEIGRTLTVGGSYSPSYFKGFSFSVDYYKIKIKGAIFNLGASALTQACKAGSAAACANIVRDSTNTVITAFSNAQNLAQFSTEGYDFDATYATRLSRISSSLPGTLRVRALATYIKHFIVDTGVTRVDSAGDVGDATANANPHWRATLSAAFQGKLLGLDARVRYVGGGKFNHLLDPATDSAGMMTGLVNNHIGARTYLDLGAQFHIRDRLTLFGNVNNVFNKAPPLTTQSSAFYDVVGTYFSGGARVKF